jgi:FimV-like protein
LPKDKPVKEAPAKPAAVAKEKPPATDKEPGQTIEVQPGDTASELIMANPTGDVSLDQLLVTMLRNNPRAFVDNNVNRLKAGSLLTMPTVEEARAVDRKEAKESIRLQAQDFDAYRTQLAGQTGKTKLADNSERQASGGLKAQLKNNGKAPADKLTLSKPGATDADKVSQQLEAQQAEQRNQEVSKNVNELGEISKAASKMQEGLPTNMSSLSAYTQQALTWIKRYAFELIGALAVLAAVLVSFSLMRDRRRKGRDRDEDAADDLDFLQDPAPHSQPPELKLDFDLDLPPVSPAPIQDPPPVSNSNQYAGMQRPNPTPDPVAMGEDPFKVRLDLADELWKLGQKQTGRALAQEVADQTHGETRERALRWLNERT